MAWVKRSIARALSDRKGVTAIEYVLIATGAGTVVISCYNLFFERAAAMLDKIGS